MPIIFNFKWNWCYLSKTYVCIIKTALLGLTVLLREYILFIFNLWFILVYFRTYLRSQIYTTKLIGKQINKLDLT